MKTAKIIGLVAGISSIFLWIVLNYANPYNNAGDLDVVINTFFMLLLPACLAIVASLVSRYLLMIIAFLWSLPISLYLALTPSIFKLFIVTSSLYLISSIILYKKHY